METNIELTSPDQLWEETKPKKSFTEFLKKNYVYFIAPALVMFIYILALIGYGIYPFGDQYTVASYDLSAQICPFVEHLFDVLDGKSSLFYSYAIMGGADVTGTFLYFFISPFSFLFLVFGDGMVNRAAVVVMLFKLIATAFAGTWFVKKLFKNIPDYLGVCIGVVYAYCGYMFVANTYINWVDFLIYMPFTVSAFKRFVDTGKFWRFSLMMACCIYTCFSIACFAMFTVFPALVFYGLICVEKEKRNKFIANLCVAFVVAILISLPILLPALKAYSAGARSGGNGILYDLWKGFKDKTSESPQNFDSSWYIDNMSEALYRKWSYIISDSIFVLLTLAWFYRKGLQTPFAKFMAVAGALVMLPVVVDEAMLLLNMGSYMSYALRFGFLNAMYFLGGACLLLNDLCYKEDCAYDGTPLFVDQTVTSEDEEEPIGNIAKTEEKPAVAEEKETFKKRSAWDWVLLGIGAVFAILLLIFSTNDIYKSNELWGIFFDSSDTLSAIRGFSAKFAHSLGGMEVIAVWFVVVAIVFIIGVIFLGAKKVSARWLSYVLILVVATQVIFYNSQLVVGNRSTQNVTMDSYIEINEVLNENDDSYFRVKDYSDKLTACAPFTGDANSFSVFSSVIDKDNFATFNLFAYNGNGKNSYKSSHNDDKKNRSDEFGDAFMGYKYYFVPKGKIGNFEEGKKLSTYMKPYMITNEQGEEVQLTSSDGQYYVFENEIVFPSAYVLPSGEFRFEKPDEANSTYRKYNQQALYKFLRGKSLNQMQSITGSESSQYVTPETARELSEYLWQRAADIEVGAGKITAKVSGAKAGECLFLNFVASEGYVVTVNGKEVELIDNDLKFLSVALEEGDNVVEFVYKTPYVKYMGVGVIGAILGLLFVALIVMKTKLVEWSAPVIAWSAVILSIALIAFFMLYPTAAWLVKLLLL